MAKAKKTTQTTKQAEQPEPVNELTQVLRVATTDRGIDRVHWLKVEDINKVIDILTKETNNKATIRLYSFNKQQLKTIF